MYVYIIGCDSAYKVGISKNVDFRLRQLQSSHWERLEVIRAFNAVNRKNAMTIERSVHDAGKMSGKHLHLEWFSPKITSDFDDITSKAHEPVGGVVSTVGYGQRMPKFIMPSSAISDSLKDRRLDIVSDATGLHRSTIVRIRDRMSSPSHGASIALSIYFEDTK